MEMKCLFFSSCTVLYTILNLITVLLGGKKFAMCLGKDMKNIPYCHAVMVLGSSYWEESQGWRLEGRENLSGSASGLHTCG